MRVNEKMTAIADAIRAKTGGTDALTLDGMAEAVPEVYDKGAQSEYDRFWDAYQLNGERRSYVGAFSGGSWNKETFKPKYPIIAAVATTVCDYAFHYFNHNSYTGTVKYNEPMDVSDIIIDFSLAPRAVNTFQDARLKNLTVDLSSCTLLSATFALGNGGYIDNLTLKVSEKCTNFTSTFSYCTTLENLTMMEGSVIGANLNVSPCPLTHDSIMSVINALKDYSGTTIARTLTLGTTNLAKLTDVEKAIATQKGWTLA